MTVVSVFVLRPEGRLTSVSNPCSTACLALTQIPDASPWVILDLRALTAVDASGIGFIAALYRAARGRGGDLHLVLAQGRVRKLLQIAGLLRVLPIFETEEEGLESFIRKAGPEAFFERVMVRAQGPWWRPLSLKPVRIEGSERITV
jgi:stage II sporulation protein AA (anti-sigma F factor antagonist)